MFRQVIGKLFGGDEGGDTETFSDCCARRIEVLPENGLPYGQRMIAFEGSLLTGIFDEAPSQQRKPNEQWWLIPIDDINLSIPWKEDTKGSIEIAARLEAATELLKLIANKRFIATKDLQKLVTDELTRLVRNLEDMPTSLAELDANQRETLRARLSLKLQDSGVRCTSIGKFIPRAAGDAAAGWDVVSDANPRLSVRWSGIIVAGWQASPEVRIVCPEGFEGRPVVDVWIDSRLDQPMRGAGITPVRLDATTWSFELFASLTKDGSPCSPGTYRMRVAVRFRDAKPGQSRFFTAGIPLHVLPDEIEDASNSEVRQKTETFPLIVDEERERVTPRVNVAFAEPTPLAEAALVHSGKRILLRGETTVHLGRERTNEIITRFLPRSEENDKLTASISRKHARIDLDAEGLVVTDLGSTVGTTLGGMRVDRPLLLPASAQSVDLVLADHPGVKPYGCRLDLIPACGTQEHRELDAEISEASRTPLPAHWRTARAAGIAAIRIEPPKQANGETVLVAFHEASLGSSPGCAVQVTGTGVAPLHASLFQLGGAWWLLNLSKETRVNDTPVQVLDLVALSPGMTLRLGKADVKFEEG